ncbi:HNHc domain-containing protein [Pseudomonas sp. OF001]|uniref:HNH endonuclease n=1 Tax=Pseudomonas sp. OF001 TaxID=2772300 RepID=UPI00191972BA|nr:HNH endonuclease [Pseudomonas sp. OF001]CAD5375809.1 HNHc domain-containing protein [Pseudomonas sp. OF001]
MSNSSEVKKSRRINFSPATKLELAKRAGFHCSYRDCVTPTTASTVNDDGEDAAAGIAVAAHIYPASKNGPRKKDGLTPDEISNISNGIWLCRTHGTLIDDFQAEFPAEKVIEMKLVREFAQKLTIKMPDVGYLVGWMGVKRLDAIVWKHWPNVDEEQIRLEVLTEGIKCVPTSEDSIWTKMPVPPSVFELKPMITAAKPAAQAGAAPEAPLRRESFAAERRRAVQIVTSWQKLLKRWGWDGEGLIHDGHVKITARNPETGEIAEPFVWARGRIVGLYRFNLVDGESVYLDINYTAHRSSNLDWHLNVTIKDGLCRTESTLSARKPITPHNSANTFERKEVEACSQVFEKLANGWEPIGYVGLEAGEWSEPETVHPEVFSIKSQITEAQIAQALQHCARVKLGYELGMTWGLCFCFNDTFLSDVLDEATIREASEALRAQVGLGPYPPYAHTDQLVTVDERFGIRLTIKYGDLFFELAQTKPRVHRNW